MCQGKSLKKQKNQRERSAVIEEVAAFFYYSTFFETKACELHSWSPPCTDLIFNYKKSDRRKRHGGKTPEKKKR